MTKMGHAQYRTTREQLLFLARFIQDIDLAAFVNSASPELETPPAASHEAYQAAKSRVFDLQLLARGLKPFKEEVGKQLARGVSHE